MFTLESLLSNLEPDHLQIIDESIKHSAHYIVDSDNNTNSIPSHIKIIISSKKFHDIGDIMCHRMIYSLLKPAFDTGLHAVAIKLIRE